MHNVAVSVDDNDNSSRDRREARLLPHTWRGVATHRDTCKLIDVRGIRGIVGLVARI